MSTGGIGGRARNRCTGSRWNSEGSAYGVRKQIFPRLLLVNKKKVSEEKKGEKSVPALQERWKETLPEGNVTNLD